MQIRQEEVVPPYCDVCSKYPKLIVIIILLLLLLPLLGSYENRSDKTLRGNGT